MDFVETFCHNGNKFYKYIRTLLKKLVDANSENKQISYFLDWKADTKNIWKASRSFCSISRF